MFSKSIGAAAIAAILSVGTASAADMALKARPVPAAEVWNWSGLYVGGNLGGAWSNNSTRYDMPFTGAGGNFATCGAPAGGTIPVLTGPNPFDLSTDCSRPSSVIGGVQIGYNWQKGAFVFGLEGDGAWQRLIQHTFVRFGTANPAPFGAPMGAVAADTAYFRSEQGGLGTIRGRVGYAGGGGDWLVNWLFYATGGLAIGNVRHSATEVLAAGISCPVAPSTTCRTGSDEGTKIGWTIGAGLEWMFAKNWSIGAEYLYVDLGSSTITLPGVGTAGPGSYFFNTSSIRFEDREHIARVKINYHFNGPIVAKY